MSTLNVGLACTPPPTHKNYGSSKVDGPNAEKIGHTKIMLYSEIPYQKNGSHYWESELMSSFLVFLEFSKLNREERGQNNNRPITLPKVMTFSTNYKYIT